MSRSSTSPSTSKLCFNSQCSNSNPNPPRNGWRLRSGEFAQLCDRCAVAYEEGRYCETYHSIASGWRYCESCGKRVHCGCIVSISLCTLLDHGGIECINCARKNAVAAPNHAGPASLYLPDRLKDLPFRSWNHLAASGPVPWRQTPSLFSSSTSSDFHPMVPNSVEISGEIYKLPQDETLPTSSTEKKVLERLTEKLRDGSLNPSSTEALVGGAGKDSMQNGKESTGETQTCKGKPQMDSKGRSQVLHQYWPRVTDQNSPQIVGDSNSAIKPLFEKMLTVSDAGKMGRLILPKKCAEAYLPPISRPDGLPLEVQDAKGKEWKLQFRYWPNNNSRIYVLEGVTPWIQNMHLQAGDIVTFSWFEPEGKLLMGFRKASSSPSLKQDKTGNGGPTHGDADLRDPESWSMVEEPGCIAKEALTGSTSVPRKRKNGTFGSESQQLRIESTDLIELELKLDEAKGLLRPPPNYVPTVVVIEGIEFEEYEDAPVIGKPTVSATDNTGEKVQWVQCEDCRKWRKLPADALLPSRWTCSHNLWDPDRSFCKVPQELTAEHLEDLLSKSNSVAPKRMKTAQERENGEALKGLVSLANSAIMGENESCTIFSQVLTEPPCHRPGCICITCIQPPSGNVPQHKQSCPCNVCLKHQFHTLALQHEKEQAEKAAETTDSKQYQHPVGHGRSGDDELHACSDPNNSRPDQQINDKGCDDDSKITFVSSPREHIDLNIKPDQEEESSLGSSNTGLVKMLQDANQRYHTQLRLMGERTSDSKQEVSIGGLSVEKITNGVNM